MTLSEIARRRRIKIIFYIGLALIVAAPILLSLAIHDRVSQDEYLRVSSSIKSWFQGRVFFAGDYERPYYMSLIADIMGWWYLYDLVCIAGGITVLCLVIAYYKWNLLPLLIPYGVLTLISLNAVITEMDSFLYNRISLIGFNMRMFRGVFPIVLYSAIVAGYIVFLVLDIVQESRVRRDIPIEDKK